MRRRDVLKGVAAAGTAAALGWLAPAARAAAAPRRTRMGLVMYTGSIRRAQQQAQADLYEPARFLEFCLGLGVSGMQIDLGIMDDAAAEAFRSQVAAADLYLEATVKPPQTDAELDRFDAQIRTVARCGALAARTVIIPGRRYEQFNDLETYREYSARGRQAVLRALPIVEKHRVPLAIENHKDHRLDERIALYREVDSEFIRATVDTGNNLALLEDPLEAVKALAPWASSVHLKDQAVRPYDDGFLLGDVPLGQGCLDLKGMVAALRSAQPKVHFSLELITREPLKVPCLTEKYWATFPTVPGTDLARTLREVRAAATDRLGQITGLDPAALLAREDANIAESIDYAVRELGL